MALKEIRQYIQQGPNAKNDHYKDFQFFVDTQASGEVKKGLNALTACWNSYLPPEQVDRLKTMWNYTYLHHTLFSIDTDHIMRNDGQEYMTHLNEVALILSREQADPTTVMGAIGHDLFENTLAKKGDVAREFGQAVVNKIEVATKVTGSDADTIAKIYEGVSNNEIGGVLIKLADRLHNMRTLGTHKKPKRRYQIAKQTYEIYAPLADRLGMTHWGDQFRDLAIPFLWPNIAKQVEELQKKHLSEEPRNEFNVRNLLFPALRSASEATLNDFSINFPIRRKSDFLSEDKNPQVKDTLPIPVEIDCSDNVGLYTDIVGFLNFINNGDVSETIHNNPDAKDAKVRVSYGVNIYELSIFTKKGKKLRETSALDLIRMPDPNDHFYSSVAIEAQKKVHSVQSFLHYAVRNRLSASRFVAEISESLQQKTWMTIRTAKEEFPVPSNFTAYDLAYFIHSDLGNRAITAIVNGERVPLNTPLQPNDAVEIEQSTNWQVLPDALETLHSGSMRRKATEAFLSLRSIYNSCRKIEEDHYIDSALEELKLANYAGKRSEIAEQLSAKLMPLIPDERKRTIVAKTAVGIFQLGFENTGDFKLYAETVNHRSRIQGLKTILQLYLEENGSFPLADLESSWDTLPKDSGPSDSSFQSFLQEVGINNANEDQIRKYLDSLRKSEESYQETQPVTTPDRRFVMARLASLIAAFANISESGVERHFNPEDLNIARMTFTVRPVTTTFDHIQDQMDKFARQMVDAPEITDDTRFAPIEVVKLPLSDQLLLLAYLSKAITLGVRIHSITVEDKSVFIMFKEPLNKTGAPLIPGLAETLRTELSEIADLSGASMKSTVN